MFLFLKRIYTRQGRRYSNPTLRMKFDGKNWETLDWSTTGCRIKKFKGHKKRGAKVVINEIGAGYEPSTRVFLHAKVTKVDIFSATLSLRFVQHCEASEKYFHRAITGVLAGRSAVGRPEGVQLGATNRRFGRRR